MGVILPGGIKILHLVANLTNFSVYWYAFVTKMQLLHSLASAIHYSLGNVHWQQMVFQFRHNSPSPDIIYWRISIIVSIWVQNMYAINIIDSRCIPVSLINYKYSNKAEFYKAYVFKDSLASCYSINFMQRQKIVKLNFSHTI